MWLLESYLKCEHCGTRLEEWDTKAGGSRHAYIPQVYTCPGCSVSGDALEAAQKKSKASGGGHGIRVRLMPKYIVDKQVRERSPEQRRRLLEQERMMLNEEKSAEADVQPRNVKALGTGHRPPPIDARRSSLADKPETGEYDDLSDTE